jgi:sugar lactone lactonase YvrE
MGARHLPSTRRLAAVAGGLAAGWLALGCSSSSAPSAPAKTPDASTGDAGDAATPYPPLVFSAIGKPVKVSDQFYFTEGPVWDPAKGVLYFTDINGDPLDAGGPSDASGVEASGDDGPSDDASAPEAAAVEAGPPAPYAGGVVYQLTPPSTIDVLFQPSGSADGLGLDPAGNLIGAGFVSRDAWRRSAAGALQTLAPCAQGSGTCYMGMPINTPDDITARSDGTIYFTDPTFASGGQGFPAVDLPLSGAQGVYRLTTDGVLHLEDSTTSGPNGVNLSPDETALYVSYTLGGQVAKFDVAADGSLSNKKVFASGVSVPDSMCVDAGGNLYVGTYGGLAVFAPTGKSLGTVSVDGLIVTNCAFGGADQRTLYVTARTQATLSGVPPFGGGLLYAISAMPVPGIPGQN